MNKTIIAFLLGLICVGGTASGADVFQYMKLYNDATVVEMNAYGMPNPYFELYNDISLLEQRYNDARARERSLENRMLSAAAIGATGIGGMMAASALAEQQADENAERDMRAYINTFRCEYGNGKTVRGGETNIELPGGNELIELYTQYATLANDLKMRKEALGLKSGIESAVVIDKADSSLYDNASVGVVGGGYASIARAIMNPDGEDADKWRMQQEEMAEKLNTGATLAGGGAIGGAIGNIKINGTDGHGGDQK